MHRAGAKYTFLALSFVLSIGSTHAATSISNYFNYDESKAYTNPYTGLRRPGTDLEAILESKILSAQKRVFVAIHELRLPRVAQALRTQKAKGLDVRVILENTHNYSLDQIDWTALNPNDTYKTPRLLDLFAFADQNQDHKLSVEELAQRDAIWILKAAKIPILDDTADGSKGSGLMHHKFVIIDSELVISASANFTLSCIHGDFLKPSSTGNANSLSVIHSSVANQAFVEEFMYMWGEGPEGQRVSRFGSNKPARAPLHIDLSDGSALTLKFAPNLKSTPREETALGLIESELAAAHESLDFALFVFSDQELSNNLELQQKRKLKIRGLVESGFIYRYYSSVLDMLGIELRDAGCRRSTENRVWDTPVQDTIGYARLNSGDILHHKFAVIDHRKIITGSFNWTQAANSLNDETLMIVDNPRLAKAYSSEFQRLYANAELGLTSKLKATLKNDKVKCGSAYASPF